MRGEGGATGLTVIFGEPLDRGRLFTEEQKIPGSGAQRGSDRFNADPQRPLNKSPPQEPHPA